VKYNTYFNNFISRVTTV